VNLKQWPVLLAVLVVVLGLALAAASQAPKVAQAAPEQAITCAWQNIGSSGKDMFHTATAYDTDANKMYVYGGFNGDFDPQNAVQSADFSGATLRATWSTVSASQARDIAGAAGAYRAKGAGADQSAVYWVGGMTDYDTGQGTNELQRYLTKSGTWERLTSGTTGLDERVFASAAYDPIHDVIWVVGGVSQCELEKVKDGTACNARALATQSLSFDAAGVPSWNTLAGGDQSIYGATLVYDVPRTRMILFGGTGNIQTGKTEVKALDLSNADVTKAKWTTLSATGTAPSSFFGGGAFFAAQNWLVFYGGSSRNFMVANETDPTKTSALNLAVSPPAWVDLSPQGSPGARVGGGMEYSPKFSAAVFVLGRKKFAVDSGATPQPSTQTVDRTTYALTCSVGPVVPTNTPPSTGPTNTPVPGQPTPTPVPTVPMPPEVCTYVQSRVPNPVLAYAVANPASVAGYNELCYPNQSASPWNVIRRFLGLENPNLAYHPMFNTVVWKCGCP